jgi:hypothetical protein
MSLYLPLQYKLPGYIGDARLLNLSLIIAISDNAVDKLGRFSREEIWLAHELEMAKMREELPGAQNQIKQLEAGADRADRAHHHQDTEAGTAIPGHGRRNTGHAIATSALRKISPSALRQHA